MCIWSTCCEIGRLWASGGCCEGHDIRPAALIFSTTISTNLYTIGGLRVKICQSERILINSYQVALIANDANLPLVSLSFLCPAQFYTMCIWSTCCEIRWLRASGGLTWSIIKRSLWQEVLLAEVVTIAAQRSTISSNTIPICMSITTTSGLVETNQEVTSHILVRSVQCNNHHVVFDFKVSCIHHLFEGCPFVKRVTIEGGVVHFTHVNLKYRRYTTITTSERSI